MTPSEVRKIRYANESDPLLMALLGYREEGDVDSEKKYKKLYHEAVDRIRKEEPDTSINPEDEFEKCKNDIVYFSENYFTIASCKKGNHIIKLYDKQKEILRGYGRGGDVVCSSTRQGGKTTLECIIALHRILFNDNVRVFISSVNQRTSNDVLDRIQFAYENVPTWLKPDYVNMNKSSIILENDSRIVAIGCDFDKMRGHNVSLLIVDELAWYPISKQCELVQHLECLNVPEFEGSGRRNKCAFFITSTPKPNTTYELFNTLWDAYSEIRQSYRIDWQDLPNLTAEWLANQIICCGSIERFVSEFGPLTRKE